MREDKLDQAQDRVLRGARVHIAERGKVVAGLQAAQPVEQLHGPI